MKMAELATKAYLIASLNVMVAARQHERPEQAFTDDEIAEILLAMAENNASLKASSPVRCYWQNNSGRLT
jgi:hypothetical protein